MSKNSFLKNLILHLKLTNKHRRVVRKLCFKMGLIWQGLIHDLSKYSIQELKIVKYYTGTRSPHQNCRDAIGYSVAWLHHKHHNKHHWEYWIDNPEDTPTKAIKMPYKYVIEEFCDMVAAGKIYMCGKWTCSSPLDYYENKCKGKRIMDVDSEKLLVDLFMRLKELGEINFYNWYKENKNLLEDTYNKK